ncbi:MAG: sulfotransferase [Pseudomonadota bacterium]
MSSFKQMIPVRVKRPLRKVKYRITWPHRRATWRGRALPDFIIIGAMKSGTSSLFAYLAQHPQLIRSSEKELNFFHQGAVLNTEDFIGDQAWYRAHFPLRRKTRTVFKTFEASPGYIFNPLVPNRIFNFIPSVKLIAILRNPTERAISHYFHEVRTKQEHLSIYQALQEEEERLRPAIESKDYWGHVFRRYSYKSRGLYKIQLERFLQYFSWQQILVLSSDELLNNTDSTLRRVFEFVGVEAEFKVKDLMPRNIGHNRTKIDPVIYEYLDNYFLPHNKALYELTGEDYGW